MKIIALIIMLSWGVAAFGQTFDRPIVQYSAAERMIYNVTPKPRANEPLVFNYFTNHGEGETISFNSECVYGTWLIPKATTLTDTVVLSGNEYPNVWRDKKDMPFRIAVKLHVLQTNTMDTSHDADVFAIQVHHDSTTAERDTEIYTIRWNEFTGLCDSVFFSDQFHFKNDFRLGQDSLLIEVHSQRPVTTFLTWIAVEDSLAHDLLAGLDLDEYNMPLQHRCDAIARRMMGEYYGGIDTTLADSMEAMAWKNRPRSEWAPYARTASIVRWLAKEKPPFLPPARKIDPYPSVIVEKTKPLR